MRKVRLCQQPPEIHDGSLILSWCRSLLAILLIAAVSVAPVGKARAVGGVVDPMRAALIEQATAALACVPTSGTLEEFLEYTGTIPVVDCLLLHLFAEFVLAQALPEVGQWDIRMLEQNKATATLASMGEVSIKANIAGYQTQINQQLNEAQAIVTQETVSKRLYLEDNKLCPLMAATRAVYHVGAAKQAIATALADAMRFQGISGSNPNARFAWYRLMCDLGLYDTSMSKDLLKSSCPNGGTSDARRSMDSTAVLGENEYVFPSNIKKLKDGRLWVDVPASPDDMPALTAIMYCAKMHASTGTPARSPDREATVSDLYLLSSQLGAQRNSNFLGDVCMRYVANRIAVPASTTIDELKKVYEQQATFCLQMKNRGCMTDDDFQKCQKSGMSSINVRIHDLCRYRDPVCVVNDLQKRGLPEKVASKIMNETNKQCEDYLRQIELSKSSGEELFSKAGAAVPIMENGLTGRQGQ